MNIHLGYEVKTGTAVAIPLRHTAVIGLTQESGKTTTLEALITRSQLRALAFVTKRGEGSFEVGRIVQPYFQEPGQDASQPLWEYVSSLLETALKGEKLRMQRSTIMRVCDASGLKKMTWERPRTLAQVATNIETALPVVRSGFEQSMLLQLREYFRMVAPEIEKLPKSTALDLQPGLNIMYLEKLSAQMQALVIASCLNWIRTREKNIITIIPEGWKFLGEGHSSPAMGAAEQLIREGGVLHNFLWLDSQDLVSIWTPIRKSIGVWILGRQGEINEAERTVKHLPTDYQKPKPSDIQRLRKGEFYVSAGEKLRKVYVQPVWMDNDKAMLVAMTESPAPARPKSDKGDDEMWRERAEKLEQENKELQQKIDTKSLALSAKEQTLESVQRQRDIFEQQVRTKTDTIGELQKMLERQDNSAPASAVKPECSPLTSKFPGASLCKENPEFVRSNIVLADEWIAVIWPLVRDTIAKDPVALKVFTAAPELEVVTTPKQIKIDGESLRGSLALMIYNGKFDKEETAKHVAIYLRQIGRGTANSNLSRELKALANMGFLTMTGNTKGTAYKRVPGLKITTRTIETN